MKTKKEELTIPGIEQMKETKETSPDPDYVAMMEEVGI